VFPERAYPYDTLQDSIGSVDLRNISHLDVNDAFVPMSIWIELNQGNVKKSYFMMPNLQLLHRKKFYYSVVIKLNHGTYFWWDGRVIRQCTTVTDVNGGDVNGTNHAFSSLQ
jgi:hypothetical protein